jgi:DNA-binding PucR family transcriptional regulator
MRRISDAEALRQFAESFDGPALDQIVASMANSIFVGVPSVGADTDLRAEQIAAVRATARGFLTSLLDDPWVAPKMPAALGDLARTMASRGFELTTLIKTTRQAQSVYWPELMASAEEKMADPAVRMRVLVLAFKRFSQFLEHELEGAVAEFQLERDRLMRGATARRNETIRALLDGDGVNTDAASRTLAYDLRRHHTALALWEPSARPGALDRLEAFAREVMAAVNTTSILIAPSSPHGLWAWIGTRAPLSRADVAGVKSIPAQPGMRVAIGQTGPGTAGFTQSHEEARAAQRIADTGAVDTSIVWHADVEIASLLSHDVKGMRALVRREVAALATAGAATAKLRATTLAYLRNACSPTAAARELGTHKNTVRYRIEQVESALGRRLEGQELGLQLALLLVETLGDEVLTDPSG